MSEPPTGFVLVDKPIGPTSHDIVAQLRKRLKTRKIGHAGTLDPTASGLLLCAVGRCTKALTYLVGADKHYDTTIKLGARTSTDDAAGEVLETADTCQISDSDIDAAIARYRGEIFQVPAAVSAIKIDGIRAHARIRAGEEVTIGARPITVHHFARTSPVRHLDDGTCEFSATVHCSSGTYVRALARDVGANLQVGGHLTALRRTAIGPLSVHDSQRLPQVNVREPVWLLPQFFPTRHVTAGETRALSYGQFIPASTTSGITVAIHNDKAVALIENHGEAARPRWVVNPV